MKGSSFIPMRRLFGLLAVLTKILDPLIEFLLIIFQTHLGSHLNLQPGEPGLKMAGMEVTDSLIQCACSNRISHKCTMCRIWFCGACTRDHRSSKPNHNLVDLKTLSSEEKSRIEQRMGFLGTRKEDLLKLIKRLNENLDEDESVKNESLRTSDTLRTECVETIHKFFDKIDDDIVKFTCTKSTKTKEERDRLTWIANDIEKRCSLMKELLMKKPENIMSESKNIIEETNYVELISKPNANTERLDIQVVKHNVWSAIDPVSLVLGDETDKIRKEDETSGKNVDYWEAANVTWTKQKQIKMQFDVKRIRAIDDTIYVCTSEGIVVYCSNMRPLTCIQITAVGVINDFIKLNDGTFVVAAKEALVHASKTGEVILRIKDGNFSCLWYNAGLIYATDKSSSNIVVCDPAKNWQTTNLLQSKDVLSVIAFKNLIYACNSGENCIRVFSLNGGPLHELDPASLEVGKMKKPFLCDIDNTGNILITDNGNWRLIVLNKKGQFRAMSFKTDFYPLSAVCLDSKLFIVSNEHIFVYSKESDDQ